MVNIRNHELWQTTGVNLVVYSLVKEKNRPCLRENVGTPVGLSGFDGFYLKIAQMWQNS